MEAMVILSTAKNWSVNSSVVVLRMCANFRTTSFTYTQGCVFTQMYTGGDFEVGFLLERY